MAETYLELLSERMRERLGERFGQMLCNRLGDMLDPNMVGEMLVKMLGLSPE